MTDSVIDDTVMDLPKLANMTPQERLTWYRSLGTLERKQLNEVCAIVVGLALSVPFAEAVEQINKTFQKRIDGR